MSSIAAKCYSSKNALEEVPLENLNYMDWVYGIGELDDFAVVGMLNYLGRLGFKLVRKDKDETNEENGRKSL